MKQILYTIFLLLLLGAYAQPKKVNVMLYPDSVIANVSDKIYGQNLESMYHSVNGGLWGETVWNRSFEELLTNNQWTIYNETILAPNSTQPSEMIIGEAKWRDCEFSFEVQKDTLQGLILAGVHLNNGNSFGPRIARDGYLISLNEGKNSQIHINQIITNNNSVDYKNLQSVAARIKPVEWNRVKIRCEKKNISLWINDSLITSISTPTQPSGWLSVGSSGSLARFRNIKVKSLQSNNLFNENPTQFRHWFNNGIGKVTVSTEAANSKYSIRLKTQKENFVLYQNNIAISENEIFKGSVYLKGSAPKGIEIAITDGTQTLASSSLTGITDKWAEFTFELRFINTFLKNARLEIRTKGETDILIDQLSMMPGTASAKNGFRPDLLKAISCLKPTVMRWPGSVFTSDFIWQNSIGLQSKRQSKGGWDESDPLAFGLDEFINLCRKTGAEPIICINPGKGDTSDLRSAANLIEYCNGSDSSKWGRLRTNMTSKKPYKVNYWEISNNGWTDNAEKYAETLNRFSATIKKNSPEAKIIACGSGSLGNEGIGLEWNKTILKKSAASIDYLSIHQFESPSKYKSGSKSFEKFINDNKQLIQGSDNPNILLDVATWNIQTTDWRAGIYTASILNVFEQNSQSIAQASPSLLMRSTASSGWDNSSIYFDNNSWFPTPIYVVTRLWRDHFGDKRIKYMADSSILSISATKSTAEKRVFIKLVNSSADSTEVRISLPINSNTGKTDMHLIAPEAINARNSFEKRENIKAKDVSVIINGNIVSGMLPPISVGIITVQIK